MTSATNVTACIPTGSPLVVPRYVPFDALPETKTSGTSTAPTAATTDVGARAGELLRYSIAKVKTVAVVP
jgi:hypothetical protein